MFLHARQIIRRRLKAAAEKAKAEGVKVEKTAEELAAEARDAAEKARAEFIAAYDRFAATLHALELRGDAKASDLIETIDRPIADLEHALDRAHVDLEAEAAEK